MVERTPEEQKVKTITTVPISITKRISVCGDKNYEKLWKEFFDKRKPSGYIKKWIIEGYKELGYEDIEYYQDIFDIDKELKIKVEEIIDIILKKLNKTIPPYVEQSSRQEFLRYKLEEDFKKENENKE